METSKNLSRNFVTPEGGWGYVIVASVVIINYVSLIPLMMFSLLYGEHLATLGDEAGQTALALQVGLGLTSLSGCFVGFIISKCSYRTIGFIGAIIYSFGAFGEHFGSSAAHLVFFVSLFKGAGFGLMQALSITVLNVYFDKKLNVAIGILHVFISIGTIAAAPFTTFLMKNIGVKNTTWLYTGSCLLNFLAIATYRPVARYPDNVSVEFQANAGIVRERNVSTETDAPVKVPLLRINENLSTHKARRIWVKIRAWIMDDFGLRLFNTLKFWNITIGLSVAFTTDLLFFSLIRVIYVSLHYTTEDIGFIMMIYFISDIIGRVSFSFMSGFWTFKNRYSFLIANISTNILRIVFFLRDDYTWTLIIIALIGWMKAFVETSISLVISEEYKNNFAQAYSMYHIIFGTICLISSPLTSFIKTYIGNDAIVVYVYCGINLVFCLTWIIEIVQVNLWKWFFNRRENC